MINSGAPAKETKLGKDIENHKQALLAETANWLRGYIPYCVHQKEFAKRYKQILTSLTKVVNHLYEEAFREWEPIVYLNNCINYCNLNPDSCVDSIKYCALYLESIYNDIVAEIEEDVSKQVMVDKVGDKKKRMKKEKEVEKAEEKKEEELNKWKKEIGDINGDLI